LRNLLNIEVGLLLVFFKCCFFLDDSCIILPMLLWIAVICMLILRKFHLKIWSSLTMDRLLKNSTKFKFYFSVISFQFKIWTHLKLNWFLEQKIVRIPQNIHHALNSLISNNHQLISFCLYSQKPPVNIFITRPTYHITFHIIIIIILIVIVFWCGNYQLRIIFHFSSSWWTSEWFDRFACSLFFVNWYRPHVCMWLSTLRLVWLLHVFIPERKNHK